jgi:murein DD-endopeptidase MepM/ murein hydrolase activator NlpD
MRAPAEPSRSLSIPHVLILGAVGLAAAGCSSDTGRFGDAAFSNPFASKSAAETTGSVPAQRAAPAVESRPLPAPQSSYQQQSYQPPAQPQRYASAPPPPPPPARPAVAAPRSAPAYQTASYQPPAYQPAPYQPAPSYQPAPPQQPEYTGSVSSTNWDWEGGTPVVVGRGDTLGSLGRRYQVPAAVIAQVNGIPPSAEVYEGQRVVIPRSKPHAAAHAPVPAPAAVAARPAPVSQRIVTGQVHVVGTGETLPLIARRYGKTIAEIQTANSMRPQHRVQPGDRIVIPGGRAAKLEAAKPSGAPAQPQFAKADPAAVPAPPPNLKVAALEPTSSVNMVKPTATPADDDSAGASGGPGFRWPVRGRIVAGFGPKPTGQQNDGINLSVPEGTPVKASDDGVVAYAGNELKGYGNLVLIRHSNGFVTAYAHASELLVKRGDKIKRGQVVAKSGQTGNVSSPQLHFEIRKGSTPVDPMQHLSGAG